MSKAFHPSHKITTALWSFDFYCKECGGFDDDLYEPCYCKEEAMGPISPLPREEPHTNPKVDEFIKKVEHLAFLPVEVRKHVPDGVAATVDRYLRMSSWILVALAIWTASTLAEFRGVATYEWLLYLSIVIVGIRYAARAGY